MSMTARDRLHRLVDKLPEHELETVRRMLSGFSAPSLPAPTASLPPSAEKIEEGGHDSENGRAVAVERRIRALDRALGCNHPTGNIEEILADIERGRDLH